MIVRNLSTAPPQRAACTLHCIIINYSSALEKAGTSHHPESCTVARGWYRLTRNNDGIMLKAASSLVRITYMFQDPLPSSKLCWILCQSYQLLNWKIDRSGENATYERGLSEH